MRRTAGHDLSMPKVTDMPPLTALTAQTGLTAPHHSMDDSCISSMNAESFKSIRFHTNTQMSSTDEQGSHLIDGTLPSKCLSRHQFERWSPEQRFRMCFVINTRSV